MANIYSQTDTSESDGYTDVHALRELVEAGADIIGKTITKMSIYMGKTTSGSIGSTDPEAKFYDASTSTTYSFGTIDVDTLTTSPVLYEFPLTPSLPAIEEGDYVVLEFPASGSNTLLAYRSPSSVYTNMVMQYNAGSWVSRSGDMSAVWEGTGGTPTSSGTFFPPPPAYVRL